MVIPRKINFTHMERYGSHCEQTYRSNFNRKRSECVNWLLFNLSLARRSLNTDGRQKVLHSLLLVLVSSSLPFGVVASVIRERVLQEFCSIDEQTCRLCLPCLLHKKCNSVTCRQEAFHSPLNEPLFHLRV